MQKMQISHGQNQIHEITIVIPQKIVKKEIQTKPFLKIFYFI